MPTALALWLLATGRWGSYVGNADIGLFVTEIALGVAVLLLLAQTARGSVKLGRLRRPPLTIVLVAVLLAWAVIRLIASDELSRDTLRDFAPYGYAVVALLVLVSPLGRWERSSRFVFGALAAHAIWVGISDNAPQLLDGLPILGGAPIFAVRPDFDATVCGMGVALCAYWLRARRAGRWGGVVIALLGVAQVALVLSLPSRAGLLAALVTVAVVLWAGRNRTRRPTRRQLAMRVGVVLTVVPLALLALAQTSPGARFVDAVQGEGTAAGTTNARQLVYETTADYILAEPTRIIFGVGFGPDFMHESGADDYYEGDLYSGVRSPHNYPLGTAARLGVLGLLLVLALTVAAVVTSWRVLRTPGEHTALDVLAAGATVGLPIAAALGVILESPFGAVPYFWAIGHLVRCRIASRDEPPPDAAVVVEEPAAQRSTRTSRPASSSSNA